MYRIQLLDKESNIIEEIEFPYPTLADVHKLLDAVFKTFPQLHHANVIDQGGGIVYHRGFGSD